MPRCIDCNRFTNFSKRGIKIYNNNGINEWKCFHCTPPLRINPKAKISSVQFMAHLRKSIAQ